MTTKTKLHNAHSTKHNSAARVLDSAMLSQVSGAGCTNGDIRKNEVGIYQVCVAGEWENAGINP